MGNTCGRMGTWRSAWCADWVRVEEERQTDTGEGDAIGGVGNGGEGSCFERGAEKRVVWREREKARGRVMWQSVAEERASGEIAEKRKTVSLEGDGRH